MRRSVWLTVEAMSSVVFATNLLLAQQGWLVTDQVSLYRAIHDHFDGARQIMAVGAQVHAYHVGLLLSPLALLGALALRRARSRTGSLVLFIGVGGAILVSEGLKLLVALPSPVGHWERHGFPSGHAAASLALFGSFAYLLTRCQVGRRVKLAGCVGSVLLTVLVGLCALTVHYANEVVAGWTVGSCALAAAAIVVESGWKSSGGTSETSMLAT